MAQPRLATSVLSLRGSYKKHPERKRKNEAISNVPFPESAPTNLTNEEKLAWEKIVSISPPGVLKVADQLCVELAAVLTARFWLERSEMPPALMNRMSIEWGKLGLSPSDRAKLTVEHPKGNEFDDV